MVQTEAKAGYRRRPKQTRAVQTVEAIVQAASQVFARRGYGATTTDHIAERAGVSVGSLYQYFSNKDSILAALAERQVVRTFDALRAELDEIGTFGDDPRQLLRHLVRATLALPMYDGGLHHLLFHHVVPPSVTTEQVRSRGRQLVAQVASMLEGSPQVKTDDVWLTAYMVVHAVEGMVRSYASNRPSGLDEDRFVEEVVHMLYRYMTEPSAQRCARDRPC